MLRKWPRTGPEGQTSRPSGLIETPPGSRGVLFGRFGALGFRERESNGGRCALEGAVCGGGERGGDFEGVGLFEIGEVGLFRSLFAAMTGLLARTTSF